MGQVIFKNNQWCGKTIEQRFWEKVDVRGPDECWEWLGARTDNYGCFSLTHEKMIGAHRYSYILNHGDIPKGMFICHACDNKMCVNPNHLFLGTPHDNTQDMMRKGRHRTNPKFGIENYHHGTNHWNNKLNETQVKMIRDYYKAGGTLTAIGKEFGVTKQAIYRIVTGKAWAWLE